MVKDDTGDSLLTEVSFPVFLRHLCLMSNVYFFYLV